MFSFESCLYIQIEKLQRENSSQTLVKDNRKCDKILFVYHERSWPNAIESTGREERLGMQYKVEHRLFLMEVQNFLLMLLHCCLSVTKPMKLNQNHSGRELGGVNFSTNTHSL